jgi:hypothetical protein
MMVEHFTHVRAAQVELGRNHQRALDLLRRGGYKHVLYAVKSGKPGSRTWNWEIGLRGFLTDAEFFEVTDQAYKDGAYWIGAVHT